MWWGCGLGVDDFDGSRGSLVMVGILCLEDNSRWKSGKMFSLLLMGTIPVAAVFLAYTPNSSFSISSLPSIFCKLWYPTKFITGLHLKLFQLCLCFVYEQERNGGMHLPPFGYQIRREGNGWEGMREMRSFIFSEKQSFLVRRHFWKKKSSPLPSL